MHGNISTFLQQYFSMHSACLLGGVGVRVARKKHVRSWEIEATMKKPKQEKTRTKRNNVNYVVHFFYFSLFVQFLGRLVYVSDSLVFLYFVALSADPWGPFILVYTFSRYVCEPVTTEVGRVEVWISTERLRPGWFLM